MQTNLQAFRQGMRDGMPICLGYLAVSFSFGIAAQGILTPLQALFMSASNLTSAGQFAGLNIILHALPYAEMALSQLVINLRYCLMSCALSQRIGPDTPLWQRLLLAYGVTDELFSLSIGGEGRLNPFYSYGATSVAAPGWALGTLLGVLSGNILPARVLSALSVALYGMFISTLMPAAKKSPLMAGIVLLSMAASLAMEKLPTFAGISPGMRIILLTVLIAGIAALLFPVAPDAKEEAA